MGTHGQEPDLSRFGDLDNPEITERDTELIAAWKAREAAKVPAIEGAGGHAAPGLIHDDEIRQADGMVGSEAAFASHDLRLPADEIMFMLKAAVLPTAEDALNEGIPLSQVLAGFWLDGMALGMEVERRRG